MRRFSLQLVWFAATTAVVYLYYTYLHFQPARGALVVRAHGLAALFMTAVFVPPVLFLGRLVFKVRREMIAAGLPSIVELAAALLIGILTPVIVIGPPPVPFNVAWALYIHFFVTGWHSSGEMARIAMWILVLTFAAFIVIRASIVAYNSQLRRLGCVLAYFWILYTGTLLFFGQAFI